ncbi:MAG: hypothetical protein CMF46_02275 [Legionellales bacterium]|nr:hypothetical protein [Legionellales bacterium]|tara:strand:- start:69 stop:2507 length:2439 start_codon:yes stop_codon:yes gene_type:complete
MESVVIINVLVIIFYLLVSSLMMPISKMLKLPFTVFLALLGIVFGLSINVLNNNSLGHGIINDIIGGISGFSFSPEMVFFVFLPAILFESALDLNVRQVAAEIKPILFLAIGGLLISTLIIGYGIQPLLNISILSCLLIGVMASATDPIAVVALFKEVGAPKNLATLVEGESLFNDATAIVLYTVLSQMLLSSDSVVWWQSVWVFSQVFFGGAIVGVLLGLLTIVLIRLCKGFSTAEVNLTIVLAYGSFLIAEHYFHVSGVMAVIFSAFTMSVTGRTVFSGYNWDKMVSIWHRFSFWSNTLIFLLMGLLFVDMLLTMTLYHMELVFVFILLATFARGVIFFTILPLLQRLKLMKAISLPFRSVMFWGGLRGTISLVLVIMLIEDPNLPEDLKMFSTILIGSFVMFTLFVNATTVASLIKYFKLDRLTTAELTMRDRVLSMVYKNISINTDLSANTLLKREKNIIQRLTTDCDMTKLTDQEWEDLAFKMLVLKEKTCYMDLYEESMIPGDVAQHLVFICDTMLDNQKELGYTKASEQSLVFSRQFLLARSVYNYTGISAYIKFLLQKRLVRLSTIYSTLQEIKKTYLKEVFQCVDQAVHAILIEKLDHRIDRVKVHLDSMSSQYPTYAKEWYSQAEDRKILQKELTEFAHMRRNSLITEGIYGNITHTLEQEFLSLHQKLILDLNQSPINMIKQVPFLKVLPDAVVNKLAKTAKPVLFFPGEFVFKQGDIANHMYFISSGSIEVLLDDGVVVLGSGSFFGELGILNQSERVASVRTLSFCDFLEVSQKDFLELMEQNPSLWAKVKQEVDKRTR